MSWYQPRVNLFEGDVEILICPTCGAGLRFDGSYGPPDRDGKRPLRSGDLRCPCGRAWQMTGGVPQLVEPRSIAGRDRLLRPIYDFIAPSHDLGVNFVLPLIQYPDPGASRDRYVRPMELAQLARRAARPRILEVGIGAGANVPLLRSHLPAGFEVDIWGVDLSPGMLLQCALRAELLYGEPELRLLMADAHNLPFADASFDRVFHVGGINGYRDVAGGLAEMARVAKPGTPIVVVDEELDPTRQHSLRHRLAFDSLTWFDRNPHAPVDLLPHGAIDVEVSRVSRFYYCLRFRMPDGAATGPAQTVEMFAQAMKDARDAARKPSERAARAARAEGARKARLRAAQDALTGTTTQRRPRPTKKRARTAKKSPRSPR